MMLIGRIALIFGFAAAVAVPAALALPLSLLNTIIALGSVLALGAGAGYTTAKASQAQRGQAAARGATAGALSGIVLGVGLLIVVLVLASTGWYDQQLRAAVATNPLLVDRGADVGFLRPTGAVAIGIWCGALALPVMLLAGGIGGMLWQATQRSQ